MLKKSVLTGTVLLIMMISPAITMAQEMPSGKWWHSPRMPKQISLTDAEKDKLEEGFRNSRRNLIDLKRNLERERFELGNLLENKTLNETEVMKQFKKLEKARLDLAVERFSFLLQVRKILGPERFQQVKAFYRKSRQKKIHPSMEGPRPSMEGPRHRDNHR
jgi:Spy/CpxP family protein refolding chaperone